MKAKNLVSMLLAGSMILGLAACAPTTSTESSQTPAAEATSTGGTGTSSDYLVYNVVRSPRPGIPSSTRPAWAAMSS